MKQSSTHYGILLIVGFLNYSQAQTAENAPAGPKQCTWTNEFNWRWNNGEREPYSKDETVTTRQISTGSDNSSPIYESCAQAISRAKEQAKKRFGSREYNRPLDGDGSRVCAPNFTPPPCYYSPPKTAVDREPQARQVEVRKIRTDSQGNACYESCRDAQKRAQEQWLNQEWGGHLDDAQDSIDQYNDEQDEIADSSSSKAKKAATMKTVGGIVAGIGAFKAGKLAMAACSSKNYGKCASWWAVAAALGVTGLNMYKGARDSRKIAADYSAGLLEPGRDEGDPDNEDDCRARNGTWDGSQCHDPDPDPNPNPGNGTNGPPGATSSRPPSPDPEAPPPLITDNNGNPLPTEKNPLENLLKTETGGGGNFDPETGTITFPDGRSYSASDLDKPEFQKFMNSPAMANFKKDMAGLESQVASAMGAEDLLNDGEGADDGSSAFDMAGGGGGGFGGYAGAGRGGGGGGDGAYGSGLGRRGLSSASGDKGDKDGQSVAGMSVKRGKDRIGVSQDNIFQMIHRKYQQKRKKQHFIEATNG